MSTHDESAQPERAPQSKPAMSRRFYQIRVQGRLPAEWSDWFDGMTITEQGDGASTLSGWVTDQPALHGLLARVRDLGLTLISIGPGKFSPEGEEGRAR